MNNNSVLSYKDYAVIKRTIQWGILCLVVILLACARYWPYAQDLTIDGYYFAPEGSFAIRAPIWPILPGQPFHVMRKRANGHDSVAFAYGPYGAGGIFELSMAPSRYLVHSAPAMDDVVRRDQQRLRVEWMRELDGATEPLVEVLHDEAIIFNGQLAHYVVLKRSQQQAIDYYNWDTCEHNWRYWTRLYWRHPSGQVYYFTTSFFTDPVTGSVMPILPANQQDFEQRLLTPNWQPFYDWAYSWREAPFLYQRKDVKPLPRRY